MEARVAVLEEIAASTKAALDRLEAALKEMRADFRETRADLRINLQDVESRLRAVEVKQGEISGKLDLLASKIPSWWQAPVSAAGLLGLLLAAIALAQHLGLIVAK